MEVRRIQGAAGGNGCLWDNSPTFGREVNLSAHRRFGHVFAGVARQDLRSGVPLLATKSGAPVAMLEDKTEANRQADELWSGDILENFGEQSPKV